ncbi:Crp/Fnr family transcriptional regulator [Ideonella sp.]|uniref:Crp/Fnr family transcriptional regulator n=1 Tax=Ideonella sp. TaxID=1929293 RepID=UPI002B481D61|nr:Crp/Fnr family transcriptional regulator [Ideonella sp.]HJV69618.1 Crp/Fnr family transcriptional regulator [Ideonella sp.]
MVDPANATALRAAMLADTWFRTCDGRMQDALLAHGRTRGLQPGEHLFAQGEAGGGLFCVLSGSLTVQSADVEGQMPVLVVLEPYHWFGELSFTDGLPRSHDAVADMPSSVFCVPREPMLAWLERHPQHWREVTRLAVGKLRIVYQIFDEEMRRPLAQRVARRLWLAFQGWGWRRDNPLHAVHWSQEQLARMLGSSRSSVNKSLRELENGGAIRLHYGTIEVLDSALLRRACDGALEPLVM